MVNPVPGFPSTNAQGVDGPAPSLADPNLVDEAQQLAYAAYSHCKTSQDVQGVTAQIVAALTNAGLPTTGGVMDFVNQLALQAKQQIDAGGTVNVSAANGPTLSDGNLANELQTLATDAFASCRSLGQVQAIVNQIGSSLTAAGLPTNGALVDYIAQLAAASANRIIATMPPPTATGGDPLNNPTLATDNTPTQDAWDQDGGVWS